MEEERKVQPASGPHRVTSGGPRQSMLAAMPAMQDQQPGQTQIEKARKDWISEEMKKRAKDYTKEINLTILLETWNVNGKPCSEDLAPLVALENYPPPDIFAIAFQEIVDLNAGNLVFDHNASEEWEDRLTVVLNRKVPYKKIATTHLVGLSLCVWVKDTHAQKVSHIQRKKVAAGILGVGGNKGAIAIRFRLYDSEIVVINSHLAAHKKNIEGRNSDFHKISKNMMFDGGQKIGDHDQVFWIGDLNYRLNLNDMEEVYRRIEVQDYQYLLEHDQLICERREGNAFKEYKEFPIDFPPTYKFQPGTQKYERREDKKRRFPAWCDRIQHIPNEDVQQLTYQRVLDLLCSDHKPVRAYFKLKARTEMKEKKLELHQQLQRAMDRWENDLRPTIAISRNSVHFSNLTFDRPMCERITIRNIGTVIAVFAFIPKLQEQHFCKRWLSVEPEYRALGPGSSVDVTLTAHVTSETAHRLNTEEDRLDDLLVLSLERGSQHFIEVHGDYLKSSFGSTVEYLVCTPEPVRFFSPRDQAVKGDAINEDVKPLAIPKELWRIVDFLYQNALDEEDLFMVGNPSQLELIRECVDTGQKFGDFDSHCMAEALIVFLQSLAKPVFPLSLCAQYIESMDLTAWCKRALMQLPPAHYNVFIYIVSFLREVLAHSKKNRLNADRLVLVFSGCLMHDVLSDSLQTAKRMSLTKPKHWIILKHFLTSEEFD